MLNLSKEYINHIKALIGEENIKDYLASLDMQITNGIVINKEKIDNDILDELINNYKLKEKYNNKYYTYEKNDDYSIGKNIYHHMGVIYSQEPSSYEVINDLDIISSNFNLSTEYKSNKETFKDDLNIEQDNYIRVKTM